MDILVQLGHLAGATRFRRISEKLHLDGDKIYQEAGIAFKASWFSVFYVLAKANGPLTIMEIARQIDFTHITVKNVLRELEKSELIEIIANPNDKRSKIVSISRDGRALLKVLEPLWLSFTTALQSLFDAGHPDLMNILNRIDLEIDRFPINDRVRASNSPRVAILDYHPGLKKQFFELAGHWLLGLLKGELEEEDKFSLHNPEEAYLNAGGFVFFAQHGNDVVGCVALKRLDENTCEFAKLFIDPRFRNRGIATKLIGRCVTRCKENMVGELWLQTTMSMPEAHRLYTKLGFSDRPAPKEMQILKRTDKIMCLDI